MKLDMRYYDPFKGSESNRMQVGKLCKVKLSDFNGTTYGGSDYYRLLTLPQGAMIQDFFVRLTQSTVAGGDPIPNVELYRESELLADEVGAPILFDIDTTIEVIDDWVPPSPSDPPPWLIHPSGTATLDVGAYLGGRDAILLKRSTIPYADEMCGEFILTVVYTEPTKDYHPEV